MGDRLARFRGSNPTDRIGSYMTGVRTFLGRNRLTHAREFS
jgi:hypothetical protein